MPDTGRWRWLAPAGAVLVLACLLPPVSLLARRYVFAESLQFAVFAMAGPALIVAGAPWRALRLARGPGDPPRLMDRVAAGRQRYPSLRHASGWLAGFVAVSLAWRLPPAVDALARFPGLAAAELVTLLPAGAGLWLELVGSAPARPRLARPGRAALAALAMWSTWAVAYLLGFAEHAVFRGYDPAGSGLSAVADQEIAVGLVWAVAGACFVPVIFVTMLGWLGRDTAGPDTELARLAGSGQQRAMVRGWDRVSGRAARPHQPAVRDEE
jgi:cytochrome c oxidase assembly factor CtaG